MYQGFKILCRGCGDEMQVIKESEKLIDLGTLHKQAVKEQRITVRCPKCGQDDSITLKVD